MRVACAQYAVREGDPEHNRWRSLDFVRRAVAAGADLVVLPELATSGCAFASRRDALAEEYPDGRTVRAWREEAERPGLLVAGGLLEREGEVLFNSARPGGAGSTRALPKDAPLGRGEAAVRAGTRAAGLQAAREDRVPHLLRRLVPRGRPRLRNEGRAGSLRPVHCKCRIFPSAALSEESATGTSS